MDPHRFSEELFEHRQWVLDELTAKGFIFYGDYRTVSPLHSVFGIEIDGIPTRDIAVLIEQMLTDMYPKWLTPG